MKYITEAKDLEEFIPSYLIPMVLFTDSRFQSLSADGKILYAMILEKMKETHKFGRYDEANRPYVFFPQEEVQQVLNVSIARAGEVLSELDVKHGVGLISRKSQRMGLPKRIYLAQIPSAQPEQGGTKLKPTPTTEEYQQELQKQEQLENKILKIAQGGY